jgi:septal ring factor EnvC (AmiA/AmiB activator)
VSTTPDNLESRIEAARRELEDALIVTTHLHQRQSRLLKEESEYVASHEERLRTVDERIEKLVSGASGVDERIEKLASAVGALISNRQ